MKSLQLFIFIHLLYQSLSAPSYSTDGSELEEMQQITFDLGFGKEVFDAYVQPNITTFSQGDYEEQKKTYHKGHAVKFFNMSPTAVSFYWDGGNGRLVRMGVTHAFSVSGTASFPGHKFFFAREDFVEGSGTGILKNFVVDKNNVMTTNYYYDPFTVKGDEKASDNNLMRLSFKDFERYNIIKRTMKFDEEYKKVTGRNYLSMYPRPKPKYFMWPADYFGQEHWFTTRETHFKSIPPADKIQGIKEHGENRVLKDDEPIVMSEYRTEGSHLNMTLKVMSCAPRVYEISNFLSEPEVDHIINIAKSIDLKPSSTGQDESTGSEKETKTRTSYNTWVPRENDQIIDAIYRRSADLLRIDEALLRRRDVSEFPDMISKSSIAEQLQLVHYGVGQEYTAHHDFGYAAAGDKIQGARYATLLFYLNEPEKGGETEFPRWYNGETSKGLEASPKKGKAVLFYSQLPDGNMDDLSHHAAKPILSGEKFLINLWVRDPIFN